MRKPLIRSWTTANSASELKLHFFPFDTLPIIYSHIQPHFAVYNLGTKLCGLDWLNLLFIDNPYRPLTSQHPTLFTCIQRSMDLFKEWTREQPPSNFVDMYGNDPMGVANVDSADNFRVATCRRNAPKRSCRGGQSAGKSAVDG